MGQVLVTIAVERVVVIEGGDAIVVIHLLLVGLNAGLILASLTWSTLHLLLSLLLLLAGGGEIIAIDVELVHEKVNGVHILQELV